MSTRAQCPNHSYFRLSDGNLSCDACGGPPADSALVRVYSRNKSAGIEDKETAKPTTRRSGR